jgi:tetratricopeptide (TPR) repeat protein
MATPFMSMGRHEEAEQELNRAISLKELPVALHGLGVVRMNQRRDREAIPYLLRALEIGPKTSLLYLNLGTAYARAGFPRESRDAFQSGLDVAEARLNTNPRDAFEKACLAYLCARLGETRRAVSEAAQALQLSGGANNVRWMAALTYEALGLRERTMSVIEDAPASLISQLSRFPDSEDLRKFPRFQQLMKAHNLQ